jgi:UDP-N-acetylmuramoyl-L-alanyl-D-glutamate--2,6-diaminopimelate ligase
MLLQLLLPDIAGARLVQGDEQLGITSIAYDSRKVDRGALFVAVPGFETDGHEYLAQALERAAAALLVQEDRRATWEPLLADKAVAIIAAPETRRALADVSAAFYGHPARDLRIVAVTGTKGKTTTSYLTSTLLEAGGQPTGLISSVEFKIGGKFVANSSQTTTPESLEVQALLAQMRHAGARYAVVEATSHALALQRLTHLEPDVAVFTNLYPDHLDFHPDMEHYRASKARLFAMLDDAADKGIEKLAVLNADDPASAAMRSSTKTARVLTYGVESPADVRAVEVQLSEKGSRFRLVAPQGAIEVMVPLLGLFSVYNSLAAATVALSQGVSLDAVVEGLAAFGGVPGRLEPIDCGQPFGVVVDFAHTGDSLRSILQALRPVASGRLIAVFGAGGDRDPGRRTGMGRAAAELADFTVLCNDNPRTEDPARILDQIAQSMLDAGEREGEDFGRIPDRREAMRHAFGLARESDVVLVAGKGHEPYLIVGTEYLPWDDREVAREELRALSRMAS